MFINVSYEACMKFYCCQTSVIKMTTISHPYQKTPVLPQVAVAVIGGVTLFFMLIITWVLGYQLVYAGRIFPGVSVAGVDLSGMKPTDAAVRLNETLSYRPGKVLLRYGRNFLGRQPGGAWHGL